MTPSQPLVGLRSRRIAQLLLALALLVLAIVIFPLVRDLVVVLIISVVLTYVFRPGVLSLERMGVPRTYSIISIFLLGTAIIGFTMRYFVPLLIDEGINLGSNLKEMDFSRMHDNVLLWLDQNIPGITPLLNLEPGQSEVWMERIRGAVSAWLQKSVGIVAGAFNIIYLGIMVPFITFFFLLDGDRFSKRLIERVPNRLFEMTLSLTYRIDRQLGNYLRSILTASLIFGVLTWAALWILGVKFALVLGLVNGLLNLIPYIGPALAYIPIGAVVLLTYQPLGWGLLWMVIILVGVQVVDEIVLRPLLISRSVEIHPVMVLLTVMFGGSIAGALGMFLAVPVYAVLHTIVVDFYAHLKQYRII